MDVRLDSNQSENGKYNLISGSFNKIQEIFLRVKSNALLLIVKGSFITGSVVEHIVGFSCELFFSSCSYIKLSLILRISFIYVFFTSCNLFAASLRSNIS